MASKLPRNLVCPGPAGVVPMVRKLRAFAESVGFRLLAPLCVTVAAVLAVYALLSFRSTQDHHLELFRDNARGYGDLIRRATHDGMLLNQLDQVQAAFERVAHGTDIAAVRCYDKTGVIVLSADRAEIGQHIGLESTTCRSCHGDGRIRSAAVMERSGLAHMTDAPDVLRHLVVIPNEQSCAAAACHYHPADRKVLGVLDVEMSMARLDAAIETAQGQLVWTTVILLIVIGVVAAVFVQRVVHRPVFQLREGTRRIARGDLDTRIDVRGGHELAQLAGAFNHMVEDLRAARRAVTEWSQKLEEKVVEKTEELRKAQHQVLHMEKMASLGKLSASVAHELNNPLAGMLTYARLVKREIREQPLAEEIRQELERYLNLVEQECRRCGEIVKNLLIFARRTGMKASSVNVNEIVQRSLMLVRHHLEMRGVKLESQLLDGDSEIVADADQLQQALLALLVNAVEAMDPAAGREGVLTVKMRGCRDEVRIDISDTGVGIAPELLPRIFEPFYSTKQKESGVGLGLAVVYGIVHRHGGAIEVESRPGVGTTFHLRLPRHPHMVEDAMLEAVAPPNPT